MNPAAWVHGWRRFALLALAVAAVYTPSLSASFQFDDWWSIVDNPSVHSLAAWWQSLPGIRPLLKLSHAMNWSLSPAPWGFRLVNVALHAGNAVLLMALMQRWLARLVPTQAHVAPAALAVALLFALHPVATEAVTYLSGRSITLMATFYLASLLALSVAQDSRRAARWRLLSALLFALALGVRESAVTLPLVWLLYARCRGDGWREALAPLRAHALVLGLAMLAGALTPGYHSFFGWSLQTRDLASQWRGQLEAHAYLLTGPLPGLRLNIDPDLRVPGALAARHVALLVLALALAALSWQRRKAWPWLAFGLGWYVLQLAPSNSLLPRFDLGNDRHLYLALVGPAIVLVVALVHLHHKAFVMVMTLLLVGLGGATVLRNHDYRSELALWETTVGQSPGKARPWLNLGYARQLAGDDAGALAAYRCALTREPGKARDQAAVNLATLAAQRGIRPVTHDAATSCLLP